MIEGLEFGSYIYSIKDRFFIVLVECSSVSCSSCFCHSFHFQVKKNIGRIYVHFPFSYQYSYSHSECTQETYRAHICTFFPRYINTFIWIGKLLHWALQSFVQMFKWTRWVGMRSQDRYYRQLSRYVRRRYFRKFGECKI